MRREREPQGIVALLLQARFQVLFQELQNGQEEHGRAGRGNAQQGQQGQPCQAWRGRRQAPSAPCPLPPR